MPVDVFATNASYVSAMRELDLEPAVTPTLVAASFISSLHFPASAIRRYFAPHPDGAQIADELLERQRATTWGVQARRRELYEAQALRNLVMMGRPHDQEPSYHVPPSEIRAVLGNLRSHLMTEQGFELAITPEVLPLIFQCKNTTVLVDIRTNYAYQTIQGLRITDEPDALARFSSEFERLWNAPDTICDQSTVLDLISLSLEDWESTGRLGTGRWPDMWLNTR